MCRAESGGWHTLTRVRCSDQDDRYVNTRADMAAAPRAGPGRARGPEPLPAAELIAHRSWRARACMRLVWQRT